MPLLSAALGKALPSAELPSLSVNGIQTTEVTRTRLKNTCGSKRGQGRLGRAVLGTVRAMDAFPHQNQPCFPLQLLFFNPPALRLRSLICQGGSYRNKSVLRQRDFLSLPSSPGTHHTVKGQPSPVAGQGDSSVWKTPANAASDESRATKLKCWSLFLHLRSSCSGSWEKGGLDVHTDKKYRRTEIARG